MRPAGRTRRPWTQQERQDSCPAESGTAVQQKLADSRVAPIEPVKDQKMVCVGGFAAPAKINCSATDIGFLVVLKKSTEKL